MTSDIVVSTRVHQLQGIIRVAGRSSHRCPSGRDKGHEPMTTIRNRVAGTWAILFVLTPVACTGSPATLSMRPDFEVATSAGTASVSIREPMPGLTYAESEQLVRAGMASVMRVSSDDVPMTPPFPERRIVWHVQPTAGRGTSRLAVNIFAGSVPVAYVQEVVANEATRRTMTFAIASLTKRLIEQYTAHGEQET
jgi:hypothetical protein